MLDYQKIPADLLHARSIVLLHLLMLARALGLLMSAKHAHGEYASLYPLVSWIPVDGDLFWSAICVGVAVVGVWSWWTRKMKVTVGTLVTSGAILTATGGAFFVASTWVPALVWSVVGLWALLEVDICARRLT